VEITGAFTTDRKTTTRTHATILHTRFIVALVILGRAQDVQRLLEGNSKPPVVELVHMLKEIGRRTLTLSIALQKTFQPEDLGNLVPGEEGAWLSNVLNFFPMLPAKGMHPMNFIPRFSAIEIRKLTCA